MFMLITQAKQLIERGVIYNGRKTAEVEEIKELRFIDAKKDI